MYIHVIIITYFFETILKLIFHHCYLNDYQHIITILHDDSDPMGFDVLVNSQKLTFITLAVDLMVHACTIHDEESVVIEHNNKVIAKRGSCSDKEKGHSSS